MPPLCQESWFPWEILNLKKKKKSRESNHVKRLPGFCEMRCHLLHDEVKLVSIMVDIVLILMHILHLLLHTTCGSSHDTCTIISLKKQLVLLVIRENEGQMRLRILHSFFFSFRRDVPVFVNLLIVTFIKLSNNIYFIKHAKMHSIFHEALSLFMPFHVSAKSFKSVIPHCMQLAMTS